MAFRYLCVEHLILEVFQLVSNIEIIIKHWMFILDEIKPFCKDIIMLLIQCYTTQPHSSTLELARQFFVMYGNDLTMQPMLKSFLKQLIDRTLKEMSSSGNPSDYADLIASFFQVI